LTHSETARRVHEAKTSKEIFLGSSLPPAATQIRAPVGRNVAIAEAPDGIHSMHMAGSMLPQKGLIEDAVATLRMPYPLARKLLIDRDQGAAIQAFMAGKIQVEGDISALMSIGTGLGASSEAAKTLQKQILEITE